jgi:hypothetical protein
MCKVYLFIYDLLNDIVSMSDCSVEWYDDFDDIDVPSVCMFHVFVCYDSIILSSRLVLLCPWSLLIP